MQKTNFSEDYILDVLYKQQFKLKLGINYIVLTDVSIVVALILIFFTDLSFFILLSLYSAIETIYYKFIFAYTRDGKQYEVLGYKLASEFYRKIYKKLEKINT